MSRFRRGVNFLLNCIGAGEDPKELEVEHGWYREDGTRRTPAERQGWLRAGGAIVDRYQLEDQREETPWEEIGLTRDEWERMGGRLETDDTTAKLVEEPILEGENETFFLSAQGVYGRIGPKVGIQVYSSGVVVYVKRMRNEKESLRKVLEAIEDSDYPNKFMIAKNLENIIAHPSHGMKVHKETMDELKRRGVVSATRSYLALNPGGEKSLLSALYSDIARRLTNKIITGTDSDTEHVSNQEREQQERIWHGKPFGIVSGYMTDHRVGRVLDEFEYHVDDLAISLERLSGVHDMGEDQQYRQPTPLAPKASTSD